MSLFRYKVNLTGLSDEERKNVERILNGYSDSGLYQKPGTYLFECCIDEKRIDTVLKLVPASLLQRIYH
jgi:hypothetical protein